MSETATPVTTSSDPKEWAGYRAHTVARSTGTLCVLVNADEAEIESDPELPWALLCHEHGGVCGFQGQRPARDHLAHPEEWCPTCQGEASDPTKPRVERKAAVKVERKPRPAKQREHDPMRSIPTREREMPTTPPKDAKERRLIEGSIRTGEQNAEWFEERGCHRQAALIRSRIGQWRIRLDQPITTIEDNEEDAS